MLVLNNSCVTLPTENPIHLGMNTCCPSDPLGSTVLGQLPAWQNFRDPAAENSYTVNYWKGLTVTVPANAYSNANTAVAVFDMSYTPAMVPSPPRHALLSSVGVVALQNTPSKPITISYNVKKIMDGILDTIFVPSIWSTECNRRRVANESELTIFYYESALDKWLSITQGHSYNRTSRVVKAELQPDTLARNNLVIFVGVMIGVPASALQQQQQYVLSSVGIHYQEIFRDRWNAVLDPLGGSCIFPIPVNASEIAKISDQGLAALGSPYLLKVPGDEEVASREAVLSIPPADTMYFEAAAASLLQSNRRRLLSSSTEQIRAVDTMYFEAAAASLMQSNRRKLLSSSTEQIRAVELYLIEAATPHFFNTTSLKWQPLDNCTYVNTSRAYVCHISASLIIQNGFQVMYVNVVNMTLLMHVPAHGTSATTKTATTTPAPPPPPPGIGDDFLVGIVVGSIFLLVIVPASLVGARHYYMRRHITVELTPPQLAQFNWAGITAPAAFSYLWGRAHRDAQLYASIPNDPDLGSIPELQASVGVFMHSATGHRRVRI